MLRHAKEMNLLEKEDFDKAKFYFEEAIKYDDKNATAYAGLAETQDSTDESDKAIINYEKALSLNPKLTELYTPLGIAYYQQGDINKAKTYLNKALATDADIRKRSIFSARYFIKKQIIKTRWRRFNGL